MKREERFSFNAAYCLMIFSMIPSVEVRNCLGSWHRGHLVRRLENDSKKVRLSRLLSSQTRLNCVVIAGFVLLVQAQLENIWISILKRLKRFFFWCHKQAGKCPDILSETSSIVVSNEARNVQISCQKYLALLPQTGWKMSVSLVKNIQFCCR